MVRFIARSVVACMLTCAVASAAPPSRDDADGTAAITFTGFDEHPDGSSRLYVKLSHPVAVEPTLSGTHLEYVLVGTRIPIRNNKNPLITSHFGAQVVSARLVLEDHSTVKGKGRGRKRAKTKVVAPLVADAARLVVETREVVKPLHKMIKNADGSAILVIDFAKPSRPPPPEPDVIAPPPATAKATPGDAR